MVYQLTFFFQRLDTIFLFCEPGVSSWNPFYMSFSQTAGTLQSAGLLQNPEKPWLVFPNIL